MYISYAFVLTRSVVLTGCSRRCRACRFHSRLRYSRATPCILFRDYASISRRRRSVPSHDRSPRRLSRHSAAARRFHDRPWHSDEAAGSLRSGALLDAFSETTLRQLSRPEMLMRQFPASGFCSPRSRTVNYPV